MLCPLLFELVVSCLYSMSTWPLLVSLHLCRHLDVSMQHIYRLKHAGLAFTFLKAIEWLCHSRCAMFSPTGATEPPDLCPPSLARGFLAPFPRILIAVMGNVDSDHFLTEHLPTLSSPHLLLGTCQISSTNCSLLPTLLRRLLILNLPALNPRRSLPNQLH